MREAVADISLTPKESTTYSTYNLCLQLSYCLHVCVLFCRTTSILFVSKSFIFALASPALNATRAFMILYAIFMFLGSIANIVSQCKYNKEIRSGSGGIFSIAGKNKTSYLKKMKSLLHLLLHSVGLQLSTG